MVEKLPFLPDEHHYAIAHVVARSSTMEHQIEHLLKAVLAGQPETARFVLKNLGQDRIVGLLQACLLDTFPEDKTTIDNLAAEIARVRMARNELLHWIWGKSQDPTKAVQASIRPFREDRLKELTAPDIKHIADDLMKVGKALISWNDLVHAKRTKQLEEQLKASRDRLAQLFPHSDWAAPSGGGLLGTWPLPDPQQEPSQE